MDVSSYENMGPAAPRRQLGTNQYEQRLAFVKKALPELRAIYQAAYLNLANLREALELLNRAGIELPNDSNMMIAMNHTIDMLDNNISGIEEVISRIIKSETIQPDTETLGERIRGYEVNALAKHLPQSGIILAQCIGGLFVGLNAENLQKALTPSQLAQLEAFRKTVKGESTTFKEKVVDKAFMLETSAANLNHRQEGRG